MTRSGISPAFVRDLAATGELAVVAAEASGDELRALRAGLYEIVQPVVFQCLTRKFELARGHRGCAGSVFRLDDACLDRFHDDMDAVLEDVFRNATMPVHNLEGWVRRRLTIATVNGYRRRRGERGALQRPRIPRWLATRLGEVPRLTALATDLLEFVGSDGVASTSVWPVDSWAERRALLTGDFESARREVVRDIEIVLAAMRARPNWYEAYVERPLGHKPHPAVPIQRTSSDADDLPQPTASDEVLLFELASIAVRTLGSRIAEGENPRTAAVDVVLQVFTNGTSTAGLDLPAFDELVAAGLADDATVDRVVATVRQ
ncbi:hypothetical protein ABZ345_08620 [Lentzea sp. NPDC005914]|uniref:hypothetical protein n=1 Tax=Lentzea sp. NPDC005914 TaxID=3154572 RepID=UPI0033C6022C